MRGSKGQPEGRGFLRARQQTREHKAFDVLEGSAQHCGFASVLHFITLQQAIIGPAGHEMDFQQECVDAYLQTGSDVVESRWAPAGWTRSCDCF